MPAAPRLLARIFVSLVAAAIAAIAALLLAGAEHAIALAHVQYWPYPLFLLAALAAAGVSLALPWRWRALALAALALVPAVIMDPAFGGGEGGSGRLRVMTFNPKDYQTLDAPGGLLHIAAEIARHDPDVVLMQDAHELGTNEPPVKRALFHGMTVYSHDEYVVASRLPLRDCGPRDMSYRRHERKYVRCVLTVDGVDIDLYTAHFETPRRGLDPRRGGGVEGWRANVEARLTQARAVARDLRAGLRPAVLGGDLNAPVRSLVVRELLEAGLRDSHATAGRGFGFTYGHRSRIGISFLRIDHILVSPGIAVISSQASEEGLSPHRAVVADLAVHRSR